MKVIAKITGKVFLWIFTSAIALIILLCSLLTIPAIQTFLAHKATEFISKEMQAYVSIGKLRIDFSLNIQLEDIQLNDLYGNNLISAKRGSLSFPSFNKGGANVTISNIILDEADVSFRRYDSDTVLNLMFFVDFLRSLKKDERKTIVDLQKVQLKNSRFQLRNDLTANKDIDGVWNYSNMIIDDINIKFSQILIVGDSLNLYIDKLSAKERSGFKVEELAGHLVICRSGLHCLKTNFLTANNSEAELDFRFDYTDFHDFHDFVNKISFNTDLHKCKLNLADLVYFVPAFKGMNNTVYVSASVKGPVPDFKIRNLDLRYGQATEVKGDIDLTGLPIIDETFIDFNIEKLKTNTADLVLFSLPKDKKIPIPDILKKLQWVETSGHFLGMYNNFFADATFSTAMGNASCELMLNMKTKPINYSGKLQTDALALGNLFNIKDFGDISMNGHITGEGVSIDDLNFKLESTVSSITFRNNTVRDISISGNFLSKQFDGQISCDDDDFNLNFNGLIDFNDEEPNCNFEANVRSLNLSSFRLFRPDSNVIVSADINMNITGKDIEHLRGKLKMNNIVYSENNSPYIFPDFVLTLNQDEYPNKNIQLKSNVLNVDLSGRFNYKQAFAAVQENLHSQLSNLIPPPVVSDTGQNVFDQKINFSFNLTKSIPLLEHFISNIRINENSSLNLRIGKGIKIDLAVNQQEKTNHISVEIPQLDINKKHRLNELAIVNQQNSKTFNLGVTCDSYFTKLTDTLPDIKKFDFQAAVTDNVIDFIASAMGNETNKLSDMLFEGAVKFMDMKKREMEININNGAIVWDNETFLFDASNFIYLAKDSIYIHNLGLQSHDGKSIVLKSHSEERTENGIYFNFNKINLGIFDVFFNKYQISLDGIATGKGGFIRNAYGYALGSNFEIDSFQFNHVPIGFFKGRTFWNNIEKKVLMQVSLFESQDNTENTLLRINGNFDPKNRHIDLAGKVDSLNIKVLEPYLRSFASKAEGLGTGEITFKGHISNAKLRGKIVLEKAVLGIDFLKTDYFIDKGTIDFVDTCFIFNNIPFRDNHQGKGVLNGIITHNRLRNLGVNLKITATNLLVLNTTKKDNSLFYGRAFATGTGLISGKVNEVLSMSADVTTNPFTDITLSLEESSTVTESRFITFITHEDKKGDSLVVEESKGATMLVNLKITATPDATVHVLLDPSIGSIIGNGSGTVEIVLDKNDDFYLYGPYTIAGGEFNLALGGFLTRTFRLENGGVIAWNGDPMQGTINARAIQATKVSPNDFFTEESDKKFRPISVSNILSLTGRLLRPDMAFSFTLPDADEFVRARIYDKIDTTDREGMIRQMVNVLLLGKFNVPNNSSIGGSTINSGLGHSLSELISAEINKVVSTISDKIDMRVGYRSGENTEENEYVVDVGGVFLNGKLIIRTSLGVQQQEVENQSRILGDFTAEYKLDKKMIDGSLKLKAFNVSNHQELMPTNSSNYSQGLGLSYMKEFDKLSDLFKRRNKEKKKK